MTPPKILLRVIHHQYSETGNQSYPHHSLCILVPQDNTVHVFIAIVHILPRQGPKVGHYNSPFTKVGGTYVTDSPSGKRERRVYKLKSSRIESVMKARIKY